MPEQQFPIGRRFDLPGHFAEPVMLESVRPLGEGFECRVRLFDGRQAIESQRKSAYENNPRAAREIVDNGVEAEAKDSWVVFKRPTHEERGPELSDLDCDP